MLSVPALAQSQSSAPIAYLWEAQEAVTFSEGTSLPGCVLVGEKSEETPPSLADSFFLLSVLKVPHRSNSTEAWEQWDMQCNSFMGQLHGAGGKIGKKLE